MSVKGCLQVVAVHDWHKQSKELSWLHIYPLILPRSVRWRLVCPAACKRPKHKTHAGFSQSCLCLAYFRITNMRRDQNDKNNEGKYRILWLVCNIVKWHRMTKHEPKPQHSFLSLEKMEKVLWVQVTVLISFVEENGEKNFKLFLHDLFRAFCDFAMILISKLVPPLNYLVVYT